MHILRLLGADSQGGESKDSLVQRILLFQPQEWKPEKKVDRTPVEAVSARALHEILRPYILRGLRVKVKGNTWQISIDNRKDSGSMQMPLAAIERCAKYLMPKDK